MIGHTATAPTNTYTKETERQVLAQPNFRHAAQVMEIIQSLSPLTNSPVYHREKFHLKGASE